MYEPDAASEGRDGCPLTLILLYGGEGHFRYWTERMHRRPCHLKGLHLYPLAPTQGP
jgi:hypothetical protein